MEYGSVGPPAQDSRRTDGRRPNPSVGAYTGKPIRGSAAAPAQVPAAAPLGHEPASASTITATNVTRPSIGPSVVRYALAARAYPSAGHRAGERRRGRARRPLIGRG